MALVAYDFSDSSDLEDDENITIGTLDTVTEPQQDVKENSLGTSNDQNLFNKLPQPLKKKISVVEEDDEFLHKKEVQHNATKPKAKITVPSLSDFKDVEGTIPSAKPKAVNGKKSGLLSILPQPRNATVSSTTKSFVPHILTQKPSTTVNRKKNPEPVKKPKQEAKSLADAYLDDSDNDDNDEEIKNDFFSMNKMNDISLEIAPLDINKNQTSDITDNIASGTKSRAEVLQSYFKQESVTNELQPALDDTGGFSESYVGQSSTNYENEFNVQSSISNEVLDEEAIMKLCGTRGKRKREEIQIVDVNQQEVLADARDWLLKGLMDDTTKRVSASKRRGDEPTSQQRRKHQITYLAHQAKANEAELQNQWANNRMTKRQTQSKYGF